MIIRVTEVRKRKNIGMDELAKKIGISRQALSARISGNMTLEKVDEIAVALNCDALELLEPGEEYAHFYDPVTGDWLGVRKK